MSKQRRESKYPYIIELALTDRWLDVGLSCRIMNFHKTRHIQPRHGFTAILKEGRTFRWCFSDLETARAFMSNLAAHCAKRGTAYGTKKHNFGPWKQGPFSFAVRREVSIRT
jgi:hypothetical protein